jgi:hypothetical protein
MRTVGYAYLKDILNLAILPVATPAVVRSVSRVGRVGNELAIPAAMAPGTNILDHALFALKHEGTDLQVLAAACEHIKAEHVLERLHATPKGAYVRKLGTIWEGVTGRHLGELPSMSGAPTVPLFDPKRYIVDTTARRDKRWGVAMNGLGDWAFCPSVRRTPEIITMLAADPLGQVREFLRDVAPEQVERVLAWAYLHETRSSYAIEGERPNASKAEAFAALLRKAREQSDLTQSDLVELQNAVVTNPLARESAFRRTQNHLSSNIPGAAGVSYVPPPPEMLRALLTTQTALANARLNPGLDPLVRAALVSFGFVFAHPFADGNGRLSRYLAHYTLCQSGGLPDGAILPLSTAMKRNELAYLRALQSFSAPSRRLWKVLWIDADQFEYTFLGNGCVYRYWDATECVRFFCEMALEAVRKDLRAEVEFLSLYDEVVREVNARFDIVGSTLSQLVLMAYQNQGVLSKHRRKQFADRVEEEALDFIEAQVGGLVHRLEGAGDNPDPHRR